MSQRTASKATADSDGEDHWDEEDALLEEVLQEAEGKKLKKAAKKARPSTLGTYSGHPGPHSATDPSTVQGLRPSVRLAETWT